MELLANQVLGERYRVESLLSRQTGRRTFLAWDLETERSVVLKLLLFGPDFTWDDLKLFEREAAVLQSLNLPAIPKYLNCFDVDIELGKGFVLVQTYIEAKSLQTWLNEGRTFSEAELISIATELLTILEYLHSRQPAVIHRDIKPSNILLSDRSGYSPGQVYLVDFGSVKTSVAPGSTITIVGTYGYMPPEQFGGQTSPASDLYALGATIICLATGKHPSDLPQREMRIIFAEQVNLSAHLLDWLKSMTAVSIDSRLQSASQALAQLKGEILTSSKSVIATKPFGTKIKLEKNGQVMKIILPPQGCSAETIVFLTFYSLLVFPLFAFNLFLGNWVGVVIIGIFVYVALAILYNTIFRILGVQELHINSSKILMFHSIFGIKVTTMLRAERQHITKVQLIRKFYARDTQDKTIKINPQINLWVGIEQFSIGGRIILTEPETDWLVHELSDWLDLTVSN